MCHNFMVASARRRSREASRERAVVACRDCGSAVPGATRQHQRCPACVQAAIQARSDARPRLTERRRSRGPRTPTAPASAPPAATRMCVRCLVTKADTAFARVRGTADRRPTCRACERAHGLPLSNHRSAVVARREPTPGDTWRVADGTLHTLIDATTPTLWTTLARTRRARVPYLSTLENPGQPGDRYIGWMALDTLGGGVTLPAQRGDAAQRPEGT